MKTYLMSGTVNQSFIVSVNGESITLSLRWVPDVGWIAGIAGIVEGVRVTPSLPIFKPYGYETIFFISLELEITRDEMANCYLMVA